MTVSAADTALPGNHLPETTESSTSKAPYRRRLSRSVAADIVGIADFIAVFLGGLIPALIYGVLGNVQLDLVMIVQSTLIASFISFLCLRYRNMYDTSRMDQFPIAPFELMIALLCGMIAVLGIGLPLALRNMHLVVWYAAWLSASYALLLSFRLVSQRILAALAAEGRFDERVAVFAAGHIARRVHDYLQSPGLGIFFSGVYDDRIGQDRINPEGLTVAGRLDDLIADCREGKIDRVIIALPQSAYDRLATILAKLAPLPISTHIVTHISSDLVESDTNIGVSQLGPVGLLDVKKKH